MTTKRLDPVGVAGYNFETIERARGETYTTRDDQLAPTPLVFPDNPFNDKFLSAKVILDIGAGVGRNLPWILHNTNALYIGLEPNPSMQRGFLAYQKEYLEHPEYASRICLASSFDEFPDVKIDAVVCTFVFQHIGYRTAPDQMNITDITQEIFKRSSPKAPWMLYEHDSEETGWIFRWFSENNIDPAVYIRSYDGIPELIHRGRHHLILFETP